MIWTPTSIALIRNKASIGDVNVELKVYDFDKPCEKKTKAYKKK